MCVCGKGGVLACLLGPVSDGPCAADPLALSALQQDASHYCDSRREPAQHASRATGEAGGGVGPQRCCQDHVCSVERIRS